MARLNEFISNQTNEPTKKELTEAITNVFKEKKTQEKKSKKTDCDDDKPKRKPSAYNLFYKEQSAILKEKEALKDKEDRMSAKEKMAYIAQLWKNKKSESVENKEEEKVEEESEEESEEEKEEVVVAVAKPTPVKYGGRKGTGSKK